MSGTTLTGKCRAKRGFTLIELLVVIAIIAILAAILFPVFARARENARKSTCISNVKQLATGILMYCQDYDEYMPFYPYGPDPWLNTWPHTIQPYIKNWGALNCPSNPHKTDLSYHGQSYPGWPDYALSNYWHRSARTIGQSQYAANHMLIGESCHFVLGDYRMSWPRTCNTCGASACNGNLALRNEDNAGHMGGNIVAFVDGHAKWIKCDTMFTRFNDLYNGVPF